MEGAQGLDRADPSSCDVARTEWLRNAGRAAQVRGLEMIERSKPGLIGEWLRIRSLRDYRGHCTAWPVPSEGNPARGYDCVRGPGAIQRDWSLYGTPERLRRHPNKAHQRTARFARGGRASLLGDIAEDEDHMEGV